MKFKTRVLLIEQANDDKFYSVQIFSTVDKTWSTSRVFTFREGIDGYRSKEQAESEAIKCAKELENFGERKETLVYETPSTSPSSN